MMGKKRRINVLLAIILVFSVIVFDASKSAVAETTFSCQLYCADVYANDEVCQKLINQAMTVTMPSTNIVNQLDSQYAFQSSVTAWEAAHWLTKPSGVTDDIVMDAKGYYSAIILSVFKAEYTSKDNITKTEEKVTSNVNKLMKQIKSWVKESDNSEWSKIDVGPNVQNQILSTKQSEELKKWITGDFMEDHPLLFGSAECINMIEDCLKTAKTLGDAMELMCSYVQISQMGDDMKAVLENMYSKCPSDNAILKEALLECETSADDYKKGILTADCSALTGVGVDIVGEMMDAGWSRLISLCPYAKAFMIGAKVGTWLGDTVCTTLFSTDKTIEQYKKMKCLDEVTALIRQSVTDMKTTYISNRTEDNGSNYLASVNVLFEALNLSCGFAEKYADVLYKDASLGWLFIKDNTYESYVKSVKSIQNSYASMHQDLQRIFMNQLQEEYPDEYYSFIGEESHGSSETKIPVQGISFGQDSMVIGYNDNNIYMMEKPEILPVNATNQNITYSSSDSSVVEIGEIFGSLTAKKEGRATITAITEDGGFTDTIEVIVSSGKDNPYTDIAVPHIQATGKCGNNIGWVLYADGSLVINGSGEMEIYRTFASYSPNCIVGSTYDKDVQKVIISKDITNIDSYAFNKCENLKSVQLSTGLKSIDQGAFSGCDSLSKIDIPFSVSQIGKAAFEQSGIEELVIPSNVSVINTETFKNCKKLSKISLPEGITKIGFEAFEYCNSLKNIELPSNLKLIEGSAFRLCGLENITIPSSVEDVQKNAFYGCQELGKIKIQNGVYKIQSQAFSYCKSLISIEIPPSIESMGEAVFEHCDNLQKVIVDFGVSDIGTQTFSACGQLRQVELPSTLKNIGEKVFSGCSALTSVKIPQSVEKLGNDTFYKCGALVTLELPDGITSIGNECFAYCTALKDISLPESLCIISPKMFQKCSLLSNVQMSNKVTEIGEYAFEGCSSLNDISLSNNLITVGAYAFGNCEKLPKINLPQNLLNVGEGAFASCLLLTGISIPNGVTEIAKETFSHCENLIDITLPKGITKIGDSAFSYCKNIKKIELPETVNSIGAFAFVRCSEVEKINIPKAVIMIGDDAFFRCEKLECVDIPEGLTKIGDHVFYGCSALSVIELPESIVSIGNYAFAECSSLIRLTIPKSVTTIGNNATFSGCNAVTIYCYEDSVAHKYMKEHKLKYVLIDSVTNVLAKTITINMNELDINHLMVGSNYVFQATVLPENVTDPSVRWSSSNSAVARIGTATGRLTAVSEGTTVITATANDNSGKSATVEIKVVLKKEDITEEVTTEEKTTEESTTTEYNKGDNVQIESIVDLKATPAGKNKVNITWTKVDKANGYLIYAKKKGKYGYCGLANAGTQTSYIDTKAVDTDYNFYWVYPFRYDAKGKRVIGKCTKYVYAKGICTATENLRAFSVKGGVKLTWSKKAGASGYLIYGKKTGGKYGYIGMTKGYGTTSYTDKSALKSAYNFYWVIPYHYSQGGKLVAGQTGKYVYGKAK